MRQFRYPTREVLTELPAGKLERGEDPILAAKRELEEETGYKAKCWEDLGFIYPTRGFCDEKLYLYKASELEFVNQNLDEGEILDAIEIKTEKAFQMIKSGEIKDAKTICAMMKALKL